MTTWLSGLRNEGTEPCPLGENGTGWFAAATSPLAATPSAARPERLVGEYRVSRASRISLTFRRIGSCPLDCVIAGPSREHSQAATSLRSSSGLLAGAHNHCARDISY